MVKKKAILKVKGGQTQY